MRIHSNGYVGIGTPTPTAKLEIKEGGDDSFEGLRIINTKANAVANTSFIRLGITNAGGEKLLKSLLYKKVLLETQLAYVLVQTVLVVIMVKLRRCV